MREYNEYEVGSLISTGYIERPNSSASRPQIGERTDESSMNDLPYEEPFAHSRDVLQMLVDLESESKFLSLIRSIQHRLLWL
jgi:hypothetical protein